ncbi:MAG TPA: hypothetical protein VEV63_08920 [Streptosporangiaceae bacterium]|nr:hypothetical protein [Streptosporangiaceae bacterium]
MSAEEPSAEWVPPGWHPPTAHPAPAAPPPWPPVLPMLQTPPPRLLRWPAGHTPPPLLIAAAVTTAVGWSVAAAALAASVVTGHSLSAAASALGASAFVLPVVDLVSVISLSWRRRAQPPPGAGRAFRKAARRAHGAGGPGPRLLRAVRGSERNRRRQARFAFLPRPARWGFAAMLWLTALATGWALAHGLPSWNLATAYGEQSLAAWAWMMHLVVWCRIACGSLNRSRSDASMLASEHIALSA